EQTTGLLLVGGLTSVISAAVMAYAGATLAQIMPQRAADMLVAFALALAAVELAWPVKVKPMKEPTRSYVAIGVVLLARQIGDAARFVIFALAAAAVYPITALIGGGIAGFAAIGLGWMMGDRLEQRLPLRFLRLVLAVCTFVAAVFIGLNARYMFL
ncbi:MAG: hypothetical protein AAGK02_16000, partial [Pseudomonadota bacterium]